MCLEAIRDSSEQSWYKRLAVLILSSLLLFSMSIIGGGAAASDLDPTFGNMGIVLTDFSDSRDPLPMTLQTMSQFNQMGKSSQ